MVGAMNIVSRRSLLVGALGLQTRRPNVLFLPVDDLNDWVEDFGGHPQTVTPNIHRLATTGVRFQNAYCQAPMCNPSRASLLTGLRPSTTGVYENDDTWRDGAPKAVTLPEHFMANGYRVEGCGKIFHSKQTDFGGFHAYLKDSDTDGYKGTRPKERGFNKKNFDWGALDVPDEETPDFNVAQYASDFLGRRHDQPFFLACGFVKPHLPWYAPRPYFDKFAKANVKLPPYLKDDLADVPQSAIRQQAVDTHQAIVKADKWQDAVRAYLACINYTDTNVGRVLNALDKSPHRDNTIVVFWGDHGWHLGEKDHWQKFTLWERSCRAPLIVRTPGMKTGGQDCRRVVELLDLYPTLIDYCGLPAKKELEGASLRPLLENPRAPWTRPAITSNGAGRITVRTDAWRYSRYTDGEELYDEKADPNEWTNLASRPEQAATKKRLAALLPKEINTKKTRSWDSLSPEEKQRLRRKGL